MSLKKNEDKGLMNMEKCDIFSLGMILLKIFLKLPDIKFKGMELNIHYGNPNDVN